MNKANVRKWVKALRSGKYKQVVSRLAGNDVDSKGKEYYGYCCLGVVCEIAKVKYAPSRGHLPKDAQDWLGVDSADPIIYTGIDREIGPVDISATNLNDEKEFSFKKIATLIEKHLLKGK